MRKSIFYTVLALVLGAFTISSAYAGSYDFSRKRSIGYEWGNYHNIPGTIRDNGGSVEILDATVGFDLDGALGCGGLDLEEAFKGLIDSLDPDQIADQIEDYFTTGLANYLLTQVYSSPALAAIFDSLEAFGNARTSLMQQKCMSVPELKAANAEVWATDGAKKECVDRETSSGRSGAACFEPGGLDTYLDEKEDDVNKAGSLYGLLGWDATEANPGDLALTNFIPDFKFCIKQGGRCTYANKNNKNPEISEAEMHTMGQTAVMAQLESLKATMAAVIYANGIDWVRDQAEQLYADNVYQQQGLMISDVEERTFTNPFISDIQLRSISFAGEEDDVYTDTAPEYSSNKYPPGWEEFTKIMPSEVTSDDDREFVVFLNCRSSDFGIEAVRFIESMVPSIIPAVSQINTGGKVVDSTYTDMLDNIAGLNADDMAFLQGAKLIGISTACVYNHQMHMHPTDFIELVEMGNTKATAVMAAVADRVSSLAVESILRFMKHKVLKQAIAGVREADPNNNEVFPIQQNAMVALDRVAQSIENRIATLQSTRAEKKSFSEMMVAIHEIEKENAPENRRR
jgi:hypothetical protein